MAFSGALAGGVSFGAGVAAAAPAAPPPPRCVIGPTTYVQPPAPDRPLVEALGAARTCVDAVTEDVLGMRDLEEYGLERVPTAAPTTTPKPAAPLPTAPKPTAPKPSPTTTTPATTTPTSTAPVTTPPVTTTPATGTPATGTPATGTPATGTPATGTPATGTQPDPSTSVPKAPNAPVNPPVVAGPRPPSGGTDGDGGSVGAVPVPPVRVAVPQARAAAPAPVAAPAAPVVLPPAPGATDALPAIADAPLGAVPAGDVVPFGSTLLEPVADASFLDPMGVPDLGSLPGEVAPLRILGDDVSAVTTSSRVQVLGLDGLHRGGGLPAVLGVTILSGLSGFALRHRILARIRATTAGGPEPGDLDGRHSA